jgi:DNA-binding helix-hairpin-helix protein with protein kinase domain
MIKTFEDESGRQYKVDRELGRGGQGSAYLIRGGKYVVKTLHVRGDYEKEKLRNRLAHVKRLAINDLPVAKPLAMLKAPYAGYVMELASGMAPLSSLFPRGDMDGQWFLDTGGVKRRIKLLTKTAEILKKLHGSGIIYGDLSPANIFISEDPDFSEVFLIDCDNLRTHVQPDFRIYTPRYGAPELVTDTGIMSTATDAYSFAVIAFELLTGVHPLIGDYVNEGPPELEEQAFGGKIPWVHDSKDDTNYCEIGIPAELVTSRNLMELFQKTFEEGLNNPDARPSMAKWHDTLEYILDFIIQCPNCTNTYLYDKNKTCCFLCEAERPSLALMKSYWWEYDESLGGVFSKVSQPHHILLPLEQSVPIDKRHVLMGNFSCEECICEVEHIHEGLYVYPKVDYPVSVSNVKGEPIQNITRKTKMTFYSGKFPYFIHFKPIEKSQRVFIFLNISK